MNNAVKQPLNEQDRHRFIEALDQYRRTGQSDVTCDNCGSVIRFQDVGSATKHECDCGKFTGVLRGL